jgi:hypothetical protein
VIPSFPLVGIASAAALAIGGLAGYKLGSGHWKARHTALQAQGWEQQAQAERTARVALQGQLAASQAAIARNTGVIHDYREKLDTIDADRARIGAQLRRVLAQAPRACPGGGALSETPDRPGAAEAPEDGGDGRFIALVEPAIAECRANTAAYHTLLEQLAPQL